jgi:hypothetical protein
MKWHLRTAFSWSQCLVPSSFAATLRRFPANPPAPELALRAVASEMCVMGAFFSARGFFSCRMGFPPSQTIFPPCRKFFPPWLAFLPPCGTRKRLRSLGGKLARFFGDFVPHGAFPTPREESLTPHIFSPTPRIFSPMPRIFTPAMQNHTLRPLTSAVLLLHSP